VNLDEYSQDLLNSQQRIAAALEQLTELVEMLVDIVAGKPTDSEEPETARCAW
jgi:hypothetical protein